MQQGRHELVMVERPVEIDGQAIRNHVVANVEAGSFAGFGEEVLAGFRLVLGGVVVDGVSVDESDGEASFGMLDCQVDGRDHVALKWIWDEDGMRLLMDAIII